jgi:hypothetical protein
LLVIFAKSCLLAVHNEGFFQRTKEDVAAFRTKIMNKPVISERNVIRADIMVASLDGIHEIIQTYH